MNGLYEPLLSLHSFMDLQEAVRKKQTPVLSTGVLDSQKCHMIWGLQKSEKAPALIITYSPLKAKEIYEDMRFFRKDSVWLYPAKDIVFYHADVRSIEITKGRLEVLEALLSGGDTTVVVTVEALFDWLTPKEMFQRSIIRLEPGDERDMKDLASRLVYMGYERCDLVEGPGQFAVRGGILDIYPSVGEAIYRLEFWGDEVDSIRLVDPVTQRSMEKIQEITILPMRELVYDGGSLEGAIAQIEKEWQETLNRYRQEGLMEQAAVLQGTVGEVLERLRENYSFPGVDNFIPYFFDRRVTLMDYLPENTLVFVDEPGRVKEHGENALLELHESFQNRMEKGYLLAKQLDIVASYTEILGQISRFPIGLLSTMGQTVRDFTVKAVCHFDVKPAGVLKNQIQILCDDLKFLCGKGYRVLLLAGSKTRGERMTKEILEQGIPARYTDTLEDVALEKGKVIISKGSLGKSFEYLQIQLAVIADKEIFGEERKKKRRKVKKQKGAKIDSFLDLNVGDYVVHDAHGVGIYRGIEQIVVDGVNKDYLKLSYAGGGSLYVPTNQLDMVQKYIGGDGVSPKVNKLGGNDWNKAKAKARGAVKILAKDLVALYAQRQAQKGYAFQKDTLWQREFEEAFPYEETDDQLEAVAEVKEDMESEKVMDRLLCGDVGYGKTEIAIRAAFKAVQEGKQVAYLVPTTILAQQHYNTFAQRMRDYPVTIEILSRFVTPKKQKEALARIQSGLGDIVIGTHRLLSKDVRFYNLGLVIVDEEQRFGVAHKEKLKRLKNNVDVLTLTATPIPRTLHMSLSGIRDMSLLEEPPQERQPVQTYVMEYNPEFVRDAIHRELARDGQVYYLYNRVRNIEEVAKKVEMLVPEASVAYAHGQMSERELENVMKDFIEGEIQVLVCTTIIETGLDISNVNTIIIQDADHMGLSQLYQLRGRVGRSNKLAYAYLMYKKDKVLEEAAEKRLQTIREFTEFGSGFKIAMRDLEIRGAGNLLGSEQHGHMDAVGYDMYCKLLDEAVKELNGEEVAQDWFTSVDLNINAYIPGYYIENEGIKLEIYKKIAAIQTQQDYYDMQEELEDRFGDMPECVQNLLDIAILKADAHNANIAAISQKSKGIVFMFREGLHINDIPVMELIREYKNKFLFTANPSPYLTYILDKEEPLPTCNEIRTYIRCLNHQENKLDQERV